jgi:hypothetical protein
MPRKRREIVSRHNLKNPAAVALGRLGGIAKSGHRINAEAVRFIRRSKLSGKELADMYEVTPSAISQIRCHRTWAWVRDFKE